MIKIGFWNVRGMKSHTKQFEINRMLSQNNVVLFGLLETRIKSRNMQNNIFTLEGKWSVVTNYNQHCGGRIWLVWDPKFFELNDIQTFWQGIHGRERDRIRRNEVIIKTGTKLILSPIEKTNITLLVPPKRLPSKTLFEKGLLRYLHDFIYYNQSFVPS